MEPNKNIHQELAELLTHPERVSAAHAGLLNDLLKEYPYYQPLHLLMAKAADEPARAKLLTRASLYTNGQTLYRFLFEKRALQADLYLSESPIPIGEELAVVGDEQEETLFHEDEVYEEIGEIYDPVLPVGTDPVTDAVPSEEDIFDEIGEVDLNTYRPFMNTPADDNPFSGTNEEIAGETNTHGKNTLGDEFVFESIASTDFFAFEDNFDVTEKLEEAEGTIATPPYIEEHDELAAAESERNRVSNYNDDKLPYTFLWWLAKTRKEHQSSFQPYAVPKKAVASQELQQQYVEHIFHLQSHLNGQETLPDRSEDARPSNKDTEIIDNFIRKDPQIAAPNAEQIDSENKAKKSAEDQNDLVSETLANIYIEQMLYDKAIDTYEKLSLKFPEKSRYFADLIQSIEKKI